MRQAVSLHFFTLQPVSLLEFVFLFKKHVISTWGFLHQKEEETAEGAKEAEREGGAKDGSAWRLHRRQWRLIHVLPQHHQ